MSLLDHHDSEEACVCIRLLPEQGHAKGREPEDAEQGQARVREQEDAEQGQVQGQVEQGPGLEGEEAGQEEESSEQEESSSSSSSEEEEEQEPVC